MATEQALLKQLATLNKKAKSESARHAKANQALEKEFSKLAKLAKLDITQQDVRASRDEEIAQCGGDGEELWTYWAMLIEQGLEQAWEKDDSDVDGESWTELAERDDAILSAKPKAKRPKKTVESKLKNAVQYFDRNEALERHRAYFGGVILSTKPKAKKRKNASKPILKQKKAA